MHWNIIATNPSKRVGSTTYIKLLLAVSLLLIPLAAAQVTTSQLGYHPDQYKQVVVYTNDSIDFFELLAGSESVYTGALVPATCQGGQPCLVGDFSNFTQEGVYSAYTNGSSSEAFRIDSSVYADALPIFAEFFNALRMQDSSYHPGHHAAANPPLPMIADGSFLLTTNQATYTLVRLGQAYERNPSALSFRVYEERPDIAVHIKEYADYLARLQDHDGQLTMPKGWYYNFNCPKNYDLQEGQHNQEQDACLLWDGNSDSTSVVNALTSYAHALPTISAEYGAQAGEDLLARALRTDTYIQETYTNVASPGSYGAALFILYDFTNESTYLTRAYDMREKVSTSLSREWTTGEELYWSEYIKHEAAIRDLGVYEVTDKDPREFFKKQTGDNWHRISGYGDYATASAGRNFQQSRPMLVAVIQAELTNEYLDFPDSQRVSESQLAWLTGQNRVHWWREGLQSRSFIFGIGENGVNQHIRLVQENFFEEEHEWLNGKTHIDGWIVGAYDNSGDGLLEYDDRYDSWTYTESTNHMAALGVLAFAQLDARYNDQQPLTRPYLNASTQPINDTPSNDSSSACYETLRSLPATCSAGDILTDSTDGCRQIICEGSEGSLQVLACNKPDGEAQYFEMYRQAYSGTPPRICLADICLQDQGMVTSSDYPICADKPTPPDQPPQPPPEQPLEEACHESISELPVACISGTMTTDSVSGTCRTLVCESNDASLQVLACDKPDVGAKQYFEMYKQSQSGSGVDICVGETCLEGWGFRRGGDYPLCTEEAVNGEDPPEQPPQEPPEEPDRSADLRVADWYPQGTHVVLLCEEEGFIADNYRFTFGDGHSQTRTVSDVYHIYAQPGTYTATCTAQAHEISEQSSLEVTIQ